MNTPSEEPAAAPESPAPQDGPAVEIDPSARQWGMFAHLSALLGAVITVGWAGSVGCFIGPLVIWLAKKDEMPFVNDQGKEALNFNITVAIVFLVLTLFWIGTFGIGLVVAIPGYIIVGLYWFVMTIVASIKANDGISYRYPICLRLIP